MSHIHKYIHTYIHTYIEMMMVLMLYVCMHVSLTSIILAMSFSDSSKVASEQLGLAMALEIAGKAAKMLSCPPGPWRYAPLTPGKAQAGEYIDDDDDDTAPAVLD